ncbi:MAG TPA: CHC2 zinc finger domain-containing protein [Chloroflexota bacterium]|nr:CHC2 zinc finger domain-containing protein [Chloroflexota bacterium]
MILPDDPAERTTTTREPASFRRHIDAVKDAVRIETVAADYGPLRLMGAGRLLGRCVAPEHEDKTPSMTVYTEEQRFKCYGCGEGGDVVDLVRLAEGGEVWEAMVSLATRHGIELPGRSAAWYARQKRQAPVRDALEVMKVRHVQRRLFRLFAYELAMIVDDDERREEKALVWENLEPVARMIVAGRRKA